MRKNRMRPIPPGEMTNEEFLEPLSLTANIPKMSWPIRTTDSLALRNSIRKRHAEEYSQKIVVICYVSC